MASSVQISATSASLQRRKRLTPRAQAMLFLFGLWVAIYALALASPPLLDDADATHAQAAQTMLRTGDWVTLHVNGIRYLEKAPLPYWLTALSLGLFGNNSFAVHLPLALTVLGLAALAWQWGRRAFNEPGTMPRNTQANALTPGDRVGFCAALFVLTSAGVFLFTRVFIPEALLSLLLAFALYAVLEALQTQAPHARGWAYAAWLALAAAVLTKGLIALVFVFGALALYLPLAGELGLWRRLYPLSGSLLFLSAAAPWHILAGLRNRNGPDGHGFFWFYFINEHVLRFLGRRTPVDYNKLPPTLYWLLHLVWLFPWSFFAPAAAIVLWQRRSGWFTRTSGGRSFEQRSALLLLLYSALVLVFFSLSTNQEYYTFPVYLPLLLLLAFALDHQDTDARRNATSSLAQRAVWAGYWALAVVCFAVAAALGLALWSSRHLVAAPNVGDLLAHREVGNYTLSMSHFFDLTGAAFSALRLPAALACAAFALGPLVSLHLGSVHLRRRGHALRPLVALGLMSSTFLIAAHLALNRFAPLLSSQDFARTLQQGKEDGSFAPDAEILLYGDQAFGSSIPFYLGHTVKLVNGRSTSMLFGSSFPDAPPIFLAPSQLEAAWGHGPRKLLFVPLEWRAEAETLLGARVFVVHESSGKALLTDRPFSALTTKVDRSRHAPEQ